MLLRRRMTPAATVFAFFFAFAAHAQPLPPAVDAALAHAKLPRDALAAVVVDADGTMPARLSFRADAAMNPASIAKLTTTFAALELLGPAYSWKTPVFIDGPIDGKGVLQGNLYIQGTGDPKLVTERLWLLLRRVQGLGIRTIAGDIVLDHGAFDVPPQDPGAFDGEPLRPYNASPDALLINFKSVLMTFTPAGSHALIEVEPPLAGVQFPQEVPIAGKGCGDWRAGLKADFTNRDSVRFTGAYGAACGERQWPVAYIDPSSYAVRAVGGMWRQLSGSVAGQVRDGRVPAGLLPAFEFASPPLSEVVRDINKYSNNVMAQQVFLTIALERAAHAAPATFDAARDAVGAWWRERIGGEPPAIQNGSGLARNERVTAAQLARLLQVAWASPLMPEFVSSLPLAGIDGTLRRLRGSASAHLKTGSLVDVHGVAGYVEGAGGKRWVLVAIVNHRNAVAAQDALDALIAWTAQGGR